MTDLDELFDELKEYAQPKKVAKRSPREERIIAGFEEIERFVSKHGRLPVHDEDADIFERLYAVRLDRLRALQECRELLQPIDSSGLLGSANVSAETREAIDDEELLAELSGIGADNELTELRNVRSRKEIEVAEQIAQRDRCEDFDRFRPLFERAQSELDAGIRKTLPFSRDASVDVGNFFILSGQMVLVAEKGEGFRTPNGTPDARLRVIFSNGTESDLLQRSLQRALYKDETGRRLTDPDAGPLFSGEWEAGDVESGTIYVLRSQSSEPFVVENRDLIHKIGVTGGKVESRIANAKRDPTYLLADVDIHATYKLSGINRKALEHLLHKVFAPARLDLTITDRFGHPVKPREWFMVPFSVIEEAIERLKDGSIVNMVYEPESASFVNRAGG